jgi:hypothetical protein
MECNQTCGRAVVWPRKRVAKLFPGAWACVKRAERNRTPFFVGILLRSAWAPH